MASYLYIYKLNTEEHPDLFFSDEGSLNVDYLIETMDQNKAPINEEGYPQGEGFGIVEKIMIGNVKSVQCFCITRSSLGNFNEAKFSTDTFTTERKQHTYFTKSKIYLTENNEFIIMFDNSIEERAKAKVKAQIEQLGFEMSILRITDLLIRHIQNNYSWSAATFNKIVKHGDSTRRVSFVIDPANDTDVSVVQQEYSDHGEMSHIKFDLPYTDNGNPKQITVTLYSDKHRVIINENEFSDNDSFNEFMLHLLGILNES
ncbi:hypothetical protein ORD22_05475 [Sporosarcina sp. GW1-11]|uniref:hypothetical protein n=1 Tax=Sporosarcina sp. GW1-11 TaxID=2899126 RepID=UPI00294EDBD0|nr:hypothetical protein [Sporosarcina sp. GW1-11]MDV6377714.1 hypothetical protein [Sporosarcina sp. GW1-11]